MFNASSGVNSTIQSVDINIRYSQEFKLNSEGNIVCERYILREAALIIATINFHTVCEWLHGDS